jgi:hypothetical protein
MLDDLLLDLQEASNCPKGIRGESPEAYKEKYRTKALSTFRLLLDEAEITKYNAIQ